MVERGSSAQALFCELVVRVGNATGKAVGKNQSVFEWEDASLELVPVAWNNSSPAVLFVFTLTGKEIPDYINIKIMTIQGKVIKELNKDDLGDIRIGNNITDVVWDGTDTYGDRLSNGVYLYTVTIKTNGEELSQLENDNLSNQLNADKANNKLFKHSVGKIVLLR